MTKIRKATKIPLRGDLRIIRREADTKRIQSVWEKKNVITFNGTETLVMLLAPNLVLGSAIQIERQIKSMRFGTNNTAPQRTDTNLLTEAVVAASPVRIDLVDANRVIGGAGTVEFVAILASGMGNGVTYREAGLFTRGTADDPLTTTGGILFSRQVFPDQVKSSSIELEFRWRISFTV